MNKLRIQDIDFSNKRALMRVDFNVPMKNGEVVDDNRIVEALPSILYVLKNGGSVILMSHLGRPNGNRNIDYSLKPLRKIIQKHVGYPVFFLEDCVGRETEETCQKIQPRNVILLENLRFHPEEERSSRQGVVSKDSIRRFCESLSKLGDIYVNDAFGTLHRAHSSIVGIDLPQKAIGFLIQKELTFFHHFMESPDKPVLAILGGSKIQDKIHLIKSLLDQVNYMIIGGGMSYTFLKVLEEIEIGDSLYDENHAETVKEIQKMAKTKNVKLILPVDHVISTSISNDSQTKIVNNNKGILGGWKGLDIGPETVNVYGSYILRSKTILWNGPVGVFEYKPFENGTICILKFIAKAKKNKSFSIVGGGDTAAAVAKWSYTKSVDHISTGGGASLKLLEGGPLPGIVSISDG